MSANITNFYVMTESGTHNTYAAATSSASDNKAKLSGHVQSATGILEQ